MSQSLPPRLWPALPPAVQTQLAQQIAALLRCAQRREASHVDRAE
jgi:hypothetical protein